MKLFAWLTIVGGAALALTVTIGFEEPNGNLLLVSSILMFAAPAAILVHLAFTDELTHEEKRIWLRGLTGRHALAACSVYLTCDNRRDAIERLTQSAPVPE
jgi:hypothetical protein